MGTRHISLWVALLAAPGTVLAQEGDEASVATTTEPAEEVAEVEAPAAPEPEPDCPCGVLFGEVFDDAGEPVEGAEVFVPLGNGRIVTAATDAAGAYRIERAPAGEYELVAEAGERRDRAREMLRPGEAHQRDFVVREPVEVHFTGGEMATAAVSRRPRSTSGEGIVAPAGTLELEGRFDVLASDVPVGAGGETLSLTDAVLLELTGRYSLGVLQIETTTAALVKQAGFLDESFLQYGSVRLRVPVADWLVPFAGGSLLGLRDRAGLGYGGQAGVDARADAGRYLTFTGALAGVVTRFDVPSAAATLAEGVLAAEATIHGGDRSGGIGFGVQYALPVWHRGANFDPDASIAFYTRLVYSMVEDWDLYLEGVLHDRGEPEAPATQIPVLSGGFDQTRLSFGVTHHFRPDSDGDGDDDDDY